MASHVAASAYGHCLALVGDEAVATELAVVAVRRGGRALGAVLGHARHLALEAVAADRPPPATLRADASPGAVAWALASTRPPLELAVMDLSGRYGLGRSALGLALRTTPSAAAARVAAVARVWDARLDPALLAWLGPGDCNELAAVLPRPGAGADDLLAVAPDVAAHTVVCEPCADRQRAMASVRLLVGGTPLPEPPIAVSVAADGSRLQPPLPPPALEPHRTRTGTRSLAVAAAVVALAGLGALVTADRRDDERRRQSVDALTKLAAAGGTLRLVPAQVDPHAGRVALANGSGVPVSWDAAGDAPWLEVSPPAGRLAPGEEQVLVLQGAPPEGDVRASVRVTGDDGSVAMTAVAGTVEHPPDLGATADGCRVTADVEDEGEVTLTLHWRTGGVETTAAMTPPVEATSVAMLPPSTPLTWWVSAIDGRGNQARTPDVQVAAGC